jgi:hypothetical protein
MEFELKTGPQGHVYFPKRIRKIFGEKMKLLPNDITGVIYSENARLSDVIASLELIIQHLALQENNFASSDKVELKCRKVKDQKY